MRLGGPHENVPFGQTRISADTRGPAVVKPGCQNMLPSDSEALLLRVFRYAGWAAGFVGRKAVALGLP